MFSQIKAISGKFPTPFFFGFLVASTLSCNLLFGAPTVTPSPSPTMTATLTATPALTQTATITLIPTHAPTSTPEKAFYSNPSIGLSVTYPSDWTASEDVFLAVFTAPDGMGQISMGFFALEEGVTTVDVVDALITIRMRAIDESTQVPIEHEGGDPIEVLLSGIDASGVRWVYHFVVADSGESAFVVETVATADNQEALQPIFEEIIQSVERISE
jgi:hypothetical protein